MPQRFWLSSARLLTRPAPLSAGGQCLDLGKRLTCRCPPGFAGAHCETNVDDCASSPCRNAGTCVDGINNFTCTCTLGFTGRDCSLRTSACDSFPCHNGGTCYAHFSGPVSVAFGLVTLALLLCASVHIMHHLHRGRVLTAMSTHAGSRQEKESFLVPGGRLKVSNKDAEMVERGGASAAMFKNKMADCNLAKEEHLTKNKFDFKHPSVVVPPLSFARDSLYQPVFIIPEKMEQCVFATEHFLSGDDITADGAVTPDPFLALQTW
ncbi:Delta-like protein C [Takifugu flavidus]|uniref:Delta-like protein C n=1 Tax=Takifugu flavidus TaxID=433684 RepID=A0A5C6MEF3_9TELE|nr:Delta-like protein C [Takifugu flavidus]